MTEPRPAPPADAPVEVLVAHGSAAQRDLLVRLFDADPGMNVVGTARDGEEAVARTRELQPSVVVLAVELPEIDGYEATKRIMVDQPTPIVVVTSSEPRTVEVALRAVRVGALAVLPEPSGASSPTAERDAKQLVTLVKAFADVKVVRRRWTPAITDPGTTPPRRFRGLRPRKTPVAAVGVAASTGGPAAVYRLLERLPPEFDAPILLVQHIAPGFLDGFVSWLGSGTALPVVEAVDGDPLEGGVVYVAPDGRHLEVDDDHRVALRDHDPHAGFRPSATHLFESLGRVYGAEAAAVVLTGMGSDGLAGARTVRERGGLVLAQDEKSSVVFGMPRAVIDEGLAHEVGPVDALTLILVNAVPMKDR